MLYNLYANQEMGRIEKISGNAVLVFEAIKQLMALNYIEIVIYEDKRHYILHQELILQQIPLFIKTTKTLSRAIVELKEVDLIIYSGTNRQPAYAFTDKAMSYITRSTGSANGGETILAESQKQKKKPLFDLNRPTKLSDLKPEYYQLLEVHAKKMCVTKNISFEEFGSFVDHHGSKGTKFINYLRAFSTWLRNYKKYNQANDAESGTIAGVKL